MSVDHDDLVEDHTKGKSPELCVNTDCERYPPQDEEEEWVKCTLCDGFFNDDGVGDILYIEEEPNNKTAQCDLCGKDSNIVQMKGSGQFLCGDACDDEDDDEDEDED